MKKSVGIVGVSGYGGGETLRICAHHPEFEVAYVAGESSAGSKLSDRFPSIGALGDLTIKKWDPAKLPKLDLLFASLPTGQSREALAKVPDSTRIVDIGGDHRYVDGWVYGLADVWPEKIRMSRRIANPGCYPSAALLALAPLLHAGIVEPDSNIIIDAKSGVSGAGRGGADGKFSFSEVNEDLMAYGLTGHAHLREIELTVAALAQGAKAIVTFTPHLVPMTRGLFATCYVATQTSTDDCLAIARKFYERSRFVKVRNDAPHTKWASGTNLAFVSYAQTANRRVAVCVAAIDNLGKGAAGTAVQNANLMFGFDESAGLELTAIWP